MSPTPQRAKTAHVRAEDVEERWLLYDASEHTLGRMAARIAVQLMGKDRPTWTPSQVTGAHVVVVNSPAVRLTGRKTEQMEYQRYTGYPGGRNVTSFKNVRTRRPNDIITLAVRRMLPKTRMGRTLLRRLKVYRESDHPHQAQKPVKVEAGS